MNSAPPGPVSGENGGGSLWALWYGRWPDETIDGQEDAERGGTQLAGVYWAVIYVSRGDLEWMHHHFNLAHVGARRPCSLCRCTNTGQDTVPWTDVNFPPVWGDHCVSVQFFCGAGRQSNENHNARENGQNVHKRRIP